MRIIARFLFALVLCCTPAFAAVTPNSFITPQTPASVAVTLSASGSIVFTAGANGAICNGASLSTTSTNDLTVAFGFSSTIIIENANVATGAGTSPGVPAFNPFATENWPGLPLDNAGNPYLLLAPAQTLYAVTNSGSVGSDAFLSLSCWNF